MPALSAGTQQRERELLLIGRAAAYGSRGSLGPRVRIGLSVGLAVAAACLALQYLAGQAGYAATSYLLAIPFGLGLGAGIAAWLVSRAPATWVEVADNALAAYDPADPGALRTLQEAIRSSLQEREAWDWEAVMQWLGDERQACQAEAGSKAPRRSRFLDRML